MSSVGCCDRSPLRSGNGGAAAGPSRSPCCVWMWPSAIARLLSLFRSGTTAVAGHSFDLQRARRHAIELEHDQRHAGAEVAAWSAAVKQRPGGVDEEPARLGDADR